jgi:hypothetical protein
MFSNNAFSIIDYPDLPENTDMILVSENDQTNFESAWLNFFQDSDSSPYESEYNSEAIQIISKDEIKLKFKLFILSSDRYHETPCVLPRDAFVKCVDVPDYDGKPCVFVKHSWFVRFVESQFCCFGLIDQIGFTSESCENLNLKDYLSKRRSCLEEVAKNYPKILFILYSDSILIKLPWLLSEYKAQYKPEMLVRMFKEIRNEFKNKMNFDSYAIFVMGKNDSPDTKLLYSNEPPNLFDLHCCGSSFANLFSIDSEIKRNIKSGKHDPSNVYIDEDFLLSMKIEQKCKKTLLSDKYEYSAGFEEKKYYCVDRELIVLNQGMI